MSLISHSITGYMFRWFPCVKIHETLDLDAPIYRFISSHTTELMDLSIERRDQIYFIDKDKKTGVSDLYSLDEYSERKRTDIRKAYLIGRYDAIPNIEY